MFQDPKARAAELDCRPVSSVLEYYPLLCWTVNLQNWGEERRQEVVLRCLGVGVPSTAHQALPEVPTARDLGRGCGLALVNDAWAGEEQACAALSHQVGPSPQSQAWN